MLASQGLKVPNPISFHSYRLISLISTKFTEGHVLGLPLSQHNLTRGFFGPMGTEIGFSPQILRGADDFFAGGFPPWEMISHPPGGQGVV